MTLPMRRDACPLSIEMQLTDKRFYKNMAIYTGIYNTSSSFRKSFV